MFGFGTKKDGPTHLIQTQSHIESFEPCGMVRPISPFGYWIEIDAAFDAWPPAVTTTGAGPLATPPGTITLI